MLNKYQIARGDRPTILAEIAEAGRRQMEFGAAIQRDDNLGRRDVTVLAYNLNCRYMQQLTKRLQALDLLPEASGEVVTVDQLKRR